MARNVSESMAHKLLFANHLKCHTFVINVQITLARYYINITSILTRVKAAACRISKSDNYVLVAEMKSI